MSNQQSKPACLRALVIGGACLDRFVRTGPVTHGGKNRVETVLLAAGGGGANVAAGLAQVPGIEVILLAGTGADADGEYLRGLIESRGVSMPWGVVPARLTSTSFVATESPGGRSTIFTETGARVEPVPLDLVEERLAGSGVCWLVAPTQNGQIRPIAELAARQGLPLFLGLGTSQIDLGYDRLGEELAGPVSLLICNRQEAFRLTGQARVADQLEALKFGGRVRTVVLTDGASGLHALHEGRMVHVPPYRDTREVVDETGAGDAAQSVIGRWLLQGQPLEAALRAGARQGFEAVTALGATTRLLSEEELRFHLRLMDELAA